MLVESVVVELLIHSVHKPNERLNLLLGWSEITWAGFQRQQCSFVHVVFMEYA